VEIDGAADTVEVEYRVRSTDMTISGTIVDPYGLDVEFGDMLMEAEVSVGDTTWSSFGIPGPDGRFQIHVSSEYGPYLVCVGDDGDLPEGCGLSFYCIEGIPAGTDTIQVRVECTVERTRQSTAGDRRLIDGLCRFSDNLGMARLTALESGTADIGLYSASGRLVTTLFRGPVDAGVNSLELRRKAIAPGQYVAQVEMLARGSRSVSVQRVAMER
jgi:hypothetical protein